MKPYRLISRTQHYLLGIVLIPALFMVAAEANANCSRSERDRAEHYAQRVGQQVVEQYGGGRNIRINLETCRFNTYSNRYTNEISVS